MRQALHHLTVRTNGQAFYDVGPLVRERVAAEAVATGLLTVWCRHTSASLVVQENADPDVRADLLDFFRRLVPEGARYQHDTEGPDDMPAHIKAALTQVSLSVPVEHGVPALGTWQTIYLFEHRAAPQVRTLTLHLIGA